MSKPFRLTLTRVECVAEQFSEPGKDELYLFGIGITSRGDRYFIAPRKLGSFGTSQVTPASFKETLVDTQVHDRTGLATTAIWLFERDSGGLANGASSIESQMNELLDQHLQATAAMDLGEGRHAYALARTVIDMRGRLNELADGWNNDELSAPQIFDHTLTDPALPIPVPYRRSFIGSGTYVLEFTHRLMATAPVILG